MSELDKRICAAIERLDQKFGPLTYVICGSIGLYIQGVDLGRDFHDIDIFIPGKKRELYLRFFRLVYNQSGFKLDFLKRYFEDEEIIVETDFYGHKILVQEKTDILLAKEKIVEQHLYVERNNLYKQRNDIEKIKLILNI